MLTKSQIERFERISNQIKMPHCHFSMALIIMVLIKKDMIIKTLIIKILQSSLQTPKSMKIIKDVRILSITIIKKKNITFLNTLHLHLY